MRLIKMTRPLFVLLALALAAPVAGLGAPAQAQAPQPSRAHGDPEAEAFVQTEASKVIQILSDHALSDSEKKAKFRTLIDQVADVPRITSFVLGRYRRALSPAQYEAFAQVFRTYAQGVYESRLGDYRGQSLKVTGSLVRRPGDVVVESEVVGGRSGPSQVNWRVIKGEDGRWRAVDVEVAGIWLAITEQQDFVSTLDNHNGDIGVLIDQLRRDAQREAERAS